MVHIVKVSDLYLFIVFWKYTLLMKENAFYSEIGELANGITKMETICEHAIKYKKWQIYGSSLD